MQVYHIEKILRAMVQSGGFPVRECRGTFRAGMVPNQGNGFRHGTRHSTDGSHDTTNRPGTVYRTFYRPVEPEKDTDFFRPFHHVIDGSTGHSVLPRRRPDMAYLPHHDRQGNRGSVPVSGPRSLHSHDSPGKTAGTGERALSDATERHQDRRPACRRFSHGNACPCREYFPWIYSPPSSR